MSYTMWSAGEISQQVRDFGMNLINEELVTPSNFCTFVLILSSSVIVKIRRGFIQLHIKLWKHSARLIETLCSFSVSHLKLSKTVN